jgi:hypothetical protein
VRLAAAVALAAVASTAPAHGQPAQPPAPARKPLPPYQPGPPDAIAVAAGEDANVEPEGGRSGFTLSAAVGPAILVGINKDRATGTGAGFSFRIGRVADRDNVVTLELAGVVYPRDYMTTAGTERRINQSIIGTWGMQHWVSPAFWIRAGAGLATFTIRTQNVVDESQTRVGGAAVVGTGIDLGRWRSITVGLELMLQSAIYRDGAVFGGGLAFDLSVL